MNSPKRKSSSIARTLRPISRWISCVRPPTCARSRGVRVCVARGSIAYSAVSQPSPLPLAPAGHARPRPTRCRARASCRRRRGTSPRRTRATPRSSVTRAQRVGARGRARGGGRAECAPRSFSMMEVVDWPGVSGMTTTSPPRARTSAAPTIGRLGVVAALHDHVGLRARARARSGVSSLEDDDGVDRLRARRARRRAPPRVRTGRSGPLSRRTDASAVEPDDERVAAARARRRGRRRGRDAAGRRRRW